MTKKFNILAFDGGGLRGLMQASVIDVVMKVVTILVRSPSILKSFLVWKPTFKTEASRKHFLEILHTVEDPMHPTEVFDFIVGNCND